MLRCSACGKEVERGMKECSGCGLPLTAYAVPVAAPKVPRIKVPLLICLILFCGVLWLASRKSHESNVPPQAEADVQEQSAWKAQNEAKWKLLDPLSTPRAFMARCGKPLRRGWWQNRHALIYKGKVDTVYITFFKGEPAFRADTLLDDKMYLTDQLDALRDIGCVSAAKPK